MRSFIEILTAAGFDVEPYSGRGMGGVECASVTIIPRGCLVPGGVGNFVADVLVAMGEAEIDVVAAAFRKMRMDQLAEDTIVYFPGIAAAA